MGWGIVIAILLVALAAPAQACSRIRYEQLVAIGGMQGAGGKSLCLLLDKLGVPCVTGSKACRGKSKKSKDSCQRTEDDKHTACSNPQLEYRMPHPKLEVGNMKSLCYPLDVVNLPAHKGLLSEVKSSLDDIGNRPSACRKSGKWKSSKWRSGAVGAGGTCPKYAAFKASANMALIPVLAEVSRHNPSKKTMRYIHVVRDARQTTLSKNTNFHDLYGPALLRRTSGNEAHKESQQGDRKERERAAVWSAANLQVQDCAKKHFGDRYLAVRIEDLADTNEGRREEAIKRIRDFLGIEWKSRETNAGFRKKQTHVDRAGIHGVFDNDYHREMWKGGHAHKSKVDMGTLKSIDETSKHASEVFGYEAHDGHGGHRLGEMKEHKLKSALSKLHV
mmetsp:Transcript_30877/g.98570  ORF Transcript_30877/g.98570 Transcript_30877/m.98570 type:complete len:390 (+) Transcript_30877:115-1284(+)